MNAEDQTYAWQQLYQKNVPNDIGVTSPQGYNIHLPQVPYVLTASQLEQGAVPLYKNPAASLYRSGNVNTMLLSSTDEQCNTGCVAAIAKPDPRVLQVKPLYQPSIFKSGNDQPLPTAYNVVGMY